ncbi:MAG: Fe-S cluster assembly protein SufD [Fusobacteriaceae bacterium]|jgi:FeS assembly protein SufD|nr:SufBD protein [Fusobacteriales bacterium]MDN5303890.1 Fe-S cluster assembly protein SufD [Fusobacteriaceae bacterium]
MFENYSKYNKEKVDILNSLEKPNWKRVGYQYEFKFDKIRELPEISDNNIKKIDENIIKNTKFKNNFKENDYLLKLTELFFNSGVYIDNNKSAEYYFSFKGDKENNNILDYNIIIARENSETNIIFDYTGDIDVFRNSLFKIKVEKNAIVNLFFVQRLSENSESFSNIIVEGDRTSKINQYFFSMGGKINMISNNVYLLDKEARSEVYSVYIGDREKKIDLEFTTNHSAPYTESIIEGRGVLKDSSKKVFRGNLQFDRGAKKSIGKEAEFTLLLDKGIKSDSIPTLKCDEDDVIGEHAASAGQLNDEKLFYLMQRGFNEKEAKKIIVMSSLKPIISKINNENLVEKLYTIIEERFS